MYVAVEETKTVTTKVKNISCRTLIISTKRNIIAVCPVVQTYLLIGMMLRLCLKDCGVTKTIKR